MKEKTLQFKITLKPGNLFVLERVNGKKTEANDPTYIPIVMGEIMKDIRQLLAGKL
jgi:hypothetical protein